MKVSHVIVPQGHYLNLADSSRVLQVRTETGSADELQALAEEMMRDANRRIARAQFMLSAAIHMRAQETRTV